MVESYTRKTISDVLRSLTGDISVNYIFEKDQADSIDAGFINAVMGKFLSNEEFIATAKAVYDKNTQLILVAPDSLPIVELRKFLKSLCGESSVFICSDGVIGQTIFLKGFTMALTLPVWNEAETLGLVIESFTPVVDEIIIGIDEKTDDGSDEVARLYADEVFYFKWEKSFAKARNACLEKCTADWVFMTEGHEWLHPDSYEQFKWIRELPPVVGLIRVKRIIKDQGEEKHSVFPWLTKNNCGVHYINDSHNAVISKNQVANFITDLPSIYTVHERSDKKYEARRAQRKFMNRSNLLKDLIKDSRDSRALFYLGNEYYDYGEYAKAVEYYKRYLAVAKWAEERYQAKIFCSKCLVCLAQKDEALKMLRSCFLEDVARNEHLILMANLLQDEYPNQAIYYLRMAAAVEEPISPMWVDPTYYRALPLQKLCIIYGSMGRLNDALACARLVKTKYPDTQDVDKIISDIERALEDESKNWDSGLSDFSIVECKEGH